MNPFFVVVVVVVALVVVVVVVVVLVAVVVVVVVAPLGTFGIFILRLQVSATVLMVIRNDGCQRLSSHGV